MSVFAVESVFLIHYDVHVVNFPVIMNMQLAVKFIREGIVFHTM